MNKEDLYDQHKQFPLYLKYLNYLYIVYYFNNIIIQHIKVKKLSLIGLEIIIMLTFMVLIMRHIFLFILICHTIFEYTMHAELTKIKIEFMYFFIAEFVNKLFLSICRNVNKNLLSIFVKLYTMPLKIIFFYIQYNQEII